VVGPGLGGWLGGVKGAAVVRPRSLDSRERDRYFGWASIEYTPTGWANPNSRGKISAPTSLLPLAAGHPVGWVNRNAEWLYSRALTQSGGRVFDPAGIGLIRRILPGIYAGPARVFVAGTDEVTVLLDGIELGTHRGFRSISEWDVHLTGEPAVLGMLVRSIPEPAWRYDPAMAAVCVAPLDEDGEPRGVLWRTFTPPVNGSGAWDWRSLDNPDVIPGVTPGVVMATLIAEEKAAGGLAGLTIGFTATHDSSGQPWAPSAAVNRRFRVGDTLLQVLEALAQAGLDWDVTPAGVLRMWGRRGQPRAGGFGQLRGQTVSGDGLEATVLLASTPAGYVEVADAAAVGVYGRMTQFLEMDDVDDPRSARPLLERYVAQAAVERNEIDLALSNSPVQYSQAVRESGPAGWWRLGEATGATVAQDASGHGHHGSIQPNVTLGVEGALAGDADTAASLGPVNKPQQNRWLQRSSGFVARPDEPWTWECWVRFGDPSTGDSNPVIMSEAAGITANNYVCWLMGDNDETITTLRVYTGDNNGTVRQATVLGTPSRPLPRHEWLHLVTTYNGSGSVSGYVDGEHVLTSGLALSAGPWVPMAVGTFGALGRASIGNRFSGDLDEVAVYDRALTADEVARHYRAGRGLARNSPVPYADFALGDSFDLGRVAQIAMTQDDQAGAVEWALSLQPEVAP